MQRLRKSVSVALVAMLACVAASPVWSDAPEKEAGEMLPYEQYTLPNGLTVILHQDQNLPVVAVNLWYQVGSKDEVEGRSGFAHLFEHLMFMGTEAVPDFDVVMESGGSWNNATTSKDRTNYFDVGPSEQLETLLRLEADRLANLGAAMTQEKLDLQRKVVRNERRQSYENSPYGKAWLEIPRALYPEGHPYHEPVIGSHADLEAASVGDVVAFFDTYYVPSNATLVVAGDFEVEDAKQLIEAELGALPAGEAVPRIEAPELEPLGLKRLEMDDKVQLPKIFIAWRSPAFYAPGDAALDITSSILTSGKNSRLFKRLIYDQQIVDSVEAYQWSSLLGSIFIIEAVAQPGHTLAELEAIIDEEVARLASEPPTQREVDRARNAIETDFVRNLQRVHNRANTLNRYHFYVGNAGFIEEDLERYQKLTPQDIQATVADVLRPDQRLIIYVTPEPEAKEE